MDRQSSSDRPIACGLGTGDLRERLDWIAGLNRAALLGARRDGLRLELSYRPQALEEVRELVRREQQCCGFLSFELRVEDDAVRLVVTAPAQAREAAELLFEPLQSTSSGAPARGLPPRPGPGTLTAGPAARGRKGGADRSPWPAPAS